MYNVDVSRCVFVIGFAYQSKAIIVMFRMLFIHALDWEGSLHIPASHVAFENLRGT